MGDNAAALKALEWLRDPKSSLLSLGQVHDQKTGRFVKYAPERLTHTLQQGILDYASAPPRTSSGQTKFLTVLTARQMGKSLSSEYVLYPKAAYQPGHYHVCIADTRDRAEYLHKRVHHLHERWPTALRSETLATRETRQLTFHPRQGGKMRVLSAEAGTVGVGQSPDSFHASECAFWADFAGSMFLIWPSLMNRDHALAIFECTPWEANSDWHHHCLEAKRGAGRHCYVFAPFWDGVLNERPWEEDNVLENEEVDLLNQYAEAGLRKEHLAFRRLMMDTDVKIRRNPELFRVFYPFDDISCWITASNAAIPASALEKHKNSPDLVDWKPTLGYQEYEAPEPDALYVLGADPCGHAARDHASFQVLKCYDGEWTQVATYAEHSEPIVFSNKIMEIATRYNKAMVVVESNGVGQSVLALLRDWDYRNLFYEKLKRPGFTTTSKSLDQSLGWLIDGLLDELVLYDKNLVEQLMSYKNDKRVEENPNSEIIRGSASKRRRDRHHWDKVSALMMALAGVRQLPRRQKPQAERVEENVVLFPTWDAWNDYQNKANADKRKREAGSSLRKSHGAWYNKGPRRR